jgi:transposase InsO family protein
MDCPPAARGLPWDTAPQYLLRHRDRIFGHDFVEQVKALGIKQMRSAPRSPWQRAYVERVIGTIRRECLDHVIVFNERSLYQHLQACLVSARPPDAAATFIIGGPNSLQAR